MEDKSGVYQADLWPVFTYPARVRRIYDADTMRVDIDLGFRRWMLNTKIRLAYINAPELKGKERPEGLKARDTVRELLGNAQAVRIRCISPEPQKYGRYVCELFYHNGSQWYNLSEYLLMLGLARAYVAKS